MPAGMRRIYRRFARWRKSHTGRLPIPESLWAAAVELAKTHGVFQTAKILRLDYSKLKRLTGTAGSMRGKVTLRSAAAPAFVELVSSETAPDCLIELEGPRGKMRIHWNRVTVTELARLSQVLWESV